MKKVSGENLSCNDILYNLINQFDCFKSCPRELRSACERIIISFGVNLEMLDVVPQIKREEEGERELIASEDCERMEHPHQLIIIFFIFARATEDEKARSPFNWSLHTKCVLESILSRIFSFFYNCDICGCSLISREKNAKPVKNGGQRGRLISIPSPIFPFYFDLFSNLTTEGNWVSAPGIS